MSFIKNVEYNKTSRNYKVVYLTPVLRGKYKGILSRECKTYNDQDVPSSVLEWLDNPSVIKEEDIDGKFIRLVIGSYPVKDINGNYNYRCVANV